MPIKDAKKNGVTEVTPPFPLNSGFLFLLFVSVQGKLPRQKHSP